MVWCVVWVCDTVGIDDIDRPVNLHTHSSTPSNPPTPQVAPIPLQLPTYVRTVGQRVQGVHLQYIGVRQHQVRASRAGQPREAAVLHACRRVEGAVAQEDAPHPLRLWSVLDRGGGGGDRIPPLLLLRPLMTACSPALLLLLA